MRKRSWLAAAVCAVAVVGLSAGPALAGEVTGSGANADQNQGKSWCSFSGLNDGNPPVGQSQSYGQDVSAGRADPHVKDEGPGVLCNPNKSPLPDFPNNDKKNP